MNAVSDARCTAGGDCPVHPDIRGLHNPNSDRIAARRQAIQDAAACEVCGSTRAECMGYRRSDPVDPWLGCCPSCRHRVNESALLALLAEVESGTVRTVEEATPKPRELDMSWAKYLNQGEQWKPNGKPMVRVADMDPEWRYNASRWLERNAAKFAQQYIMGDRLWFDAECASPFGPSDASADSILQDIEDGAASRAKDPWGWIRTTALHRALVADLPDCSIALEAIAAHARHWSTCPARTDGHAECRCETIAAQCDQCRSGDICSLCEGSGCGGPCAECAPGVPEWTL